MMLEINLLPGHKKAARGGKSMTVSGALAKVSDQIRDPWLLGAATAVVVAVATVGVLFTTQQAQAGELEQRLTIAVHDSTRYANILTARRKLIAERDSVHRQLQIIRTIDDNRYNWAHILDEVSRALPAYTWLTTLEQTSKAPLPPGTDSVRAIAAAAAAAPKDKEGEKAPPKVADTVNVHPELAFRIVGQTVDIQALTMFMRQLESSPFIQKVALTRSEIVVVDGKDVTQFELSATFEVPPVGVIRTSPLTVPVR